MGKAFKQKVVLSLLALGTLVVSEQFLTGLAAQAALAGAVAMFTWVCKPKGKQPPVLPPPLL